jgi:hypothetical protein
MQKGDKFVRINEVDTDPLQSPNTIMMVCLLTLGIPLAEPFKDTRELLPNGSKRRETIWVLKEKSECGQYDTSEMVRAWHDPDWVKNNPEHPLAYMKLAFENHTRAVDHLKRDVPLALIRKGKKIALIPFNADAKTKNGLLSLLTK